MLQRSNGNNEEIENIAMIAAYMDYLMNLEENTSTHWWIHVLSAVGGSLVYKKVSYGFNGYWLWKYISEIVWPM